MQSLVCPYFGILAENLFPVVKGCVCPKALHRAEPLGIHARRPCRAILLGLPPLDQAGMLAVSRTKPLHDAVAQMADDLYGGYAPATPFLSTIEVFRQSEAMPAGLSKNLYDFLNGILG